MQDVEQQGFIARLKHRLETLQLSPRAASLQSGAGPDLIRNLLRGGAKSLRGDHLVRLADVLKVSETWLMTGEERDGTQSPEKPEGLRFGGIAEAGNFRADDGLNQSNEWRFIPISPDHRYPAHSQYAFEVKGDSMDLAQVTDGMWAVGIDIETWENLHGQVPSGKLVVVARTRNGNPERELTIKRLRYFRDHMELQPESSNPIHQPISFPLPLSEDALNHIHIIAVVLYSTRIHD